MLCWMHSGGSPLPPSCIKTTAALALHKRCNDTCYCYNLCYFLLQQAVTSGANPIAVKKGIEKTQEYLVGKLKENAKPVKGRNDIKVCDVFDQKCEVFEQGYLVLVTQYHFLWYDRSQHPKCFDCCC